MTEGLYERDIDRQLCYIERLDFVDYVFKMGVDYDHGYDTIVLSIQIADDYVKSSKNKYSIELAHVVSILSAKYNEDFGYKLIYLAADDTNNHIVYALEKEVYKCINYKITHNKFIILLYIIIGEKKLHSCFWDILKDICSNEETFKLSNINPKVILLGLILLFKNNKLSSIRKNKERIFKEFINIVSHEFEIKPEDFLKSYLNL